MTAVRSREEGVDAVAAVRWPKGARARTAVQSPEEGTRTTTAPRPPERRVEG